MESWLTPDLTEVAWMLGAALGMHGAQLIMTHLLSAHGAVYAGGASFLVSIWSALLGVLAGDALPSRNILVGAALILVPVLTMPSKVNPPILKG